MPLAVISWCRIDLCGKNNWSFCTTKIITMSSRLLPGLFGASNFLRCASNRTMMKADTLVLTIQIIVCCACKRTPPISRKLNAATNHPQHLMFFGKTCVHKITWLNPSKEEPWISIMSVCALRFVNVECVRSYWWAWKNKRTPLRLCKVSLV